MTDKGENVQKLDYGFNTKIEEFSVFKVTYRKIVGRVFEEVHKKLQDDPYTRATLKLKVFCCHIINRVFTGKVDSSIFPLYCSWVKRSNLKINYKMYNFVSL
jgi:hypothetical protein